ncbi:MAG: hypothetical protein ACYTKD_18900 [Planctomycetota bacterium]|jgi:hypothetical protein
MMNPGKTRRRSVSGTVLAAAAVSLTCLAPRSRAADLAVNAYCPFPIGSPRVLGMAGAFTGIGSGAESILANPAAVLRPDGFDLGPANIDYMLFTARQPEGMQSDFGNVGPDLTGREGVTFSGLGIIGRRTGAPRSHRGYGFYLSAESYYFADDSGRTAELGLLSPRIAFGRAYRDDELLVALALDVSNPDFKYTDPGTTNVVDVEYQSIGGVPLELGVLWAPEGKRFQIGARVKGRRESEATSTIPGIDPFPDKVTYPGEWSVGVAFPLGERSPEGVGKWFDRAVVDFDVRGVFPVTGTTGFERFRTPAPGVPLELRDDALVQPALGVEIELYTRIAWLWFGSYREPARYDDVDSRTHATGGLKLRVFKKGRFELYLAGASDVADRFNVWTVSIATSAATF